MLVLLLFIFHLINYHSLKAPLATYPVDSKCSKEDLNIDVLYEKHQQTLMFFQLQLKVFKVKQFLNILFLVLYY